ncbi:hypothetical protein [Aneurinibacillus sp. UBA3580]|jgi:hypothetical protein|uniref:hypothetical protein n=1 Tax=Aneurinibacillus sp. UBA3580 TaxID=1946041 RepID=UPI00257D6615|nr:hypothetical protein [Aneurinibacillus sp. UBA3580]
MRECDRKIEILSAFFPLFSFDDFHPITRRKYEPCPAGRTVDKKCGYHFKA